MLTGEAMPHFSSLTALHWFGNIFVKTWQVVVEVFLSSFTILLLKQITVSTSTNKHRQILKY